MKKMIALLLACSLFLCSCAKNEGISEEQVAEPLDETTEVFESDSADEANDELYSNQTDSCDISIEGLEDDNLLRYVENKVYSDLVINIDSEEYFVENVEAVYYPKEYVEALASNSQSNRYFGYTAAELNAQFQGTKYVFTLGEDGQTTVVPMETLTDDVYIKCLENVIIGTGVILVCVTVSLVAAPAAPAVAMIFAASASTGAAFAVESGTLAFAAAAIAKGYETESFSEAMRAGAEAAGEGFKWGAISGAAFGGGKEFFALKGATLNGLSLNEAAKIQKESGYPLELIKQFKSIEEYRVYKEAGLYTKMVNGKMALVRNIDLQYVSELPNGEKVTNLVRMQKGYAPIDPATGKQYQLHHINQNMEGTLAILTESEHQGNSAILNLFGKESEINRNAFAKIRREFWKKYAAGLL
ncbi:MAG: HNH/ENDO VII family nuclease [Lachnospiraceae bacterium]|nr:HNH/ENDO VII family nuclease [Lachnospiraceae bacterium]